MSLEFSGPATRLNPEIILAAAKACGLDYPRVWAFSTVESGGHGGFLPVPDNRPELLFEAHKFCAHTGGKYTASHPDISSVAWNRALYSSSTAGEYLRLAKAIALDRNAALQSASWGMFQILGENYKTCNFDTVEAFVAAMCVSEEQHLQAFLSFVKKAGILPYLQTLNWAEAARRYNGTQYRQNGYDTKLAAAYAQACRNTPAAAPPPPPPVVAAPSSAVHATASVNVRSGPGMTFMPTVGSPLAAGEQATVLQRTASGWAQITCSRKTGDFTGWVFSNYIA